MRHLIVRLSALGDVAATLPAVKHFADTRGGEIHWVVGEIAAPLLRAMPWISRIFTVCESKLLRGSRVEQISEGVQLWAKLAGRRYDTVATLHVDRRFHLLAAPVLASQRIELTKNDRSRMLIRGRNQTMEFTRILLGRDGCLDDLKVDYSLWPLLADAIRSEQPRILLVPGGARNVMRDSPHRRWPVTKYAYLARELRRLGMRVSLIGAKDDDWVRPAFQGIDCDDWIGAFELPALLDAMQEADLVVTHDTGPLHLAALTRVPILALFGPTNPSEVVARRPGVHVIHGGDHLPCRPCYDGRELPLCSTYACMDSIDAEVVLARCLSLVGSSRTSLHPVNVIS